MRWDRPIAIVLVPKDAGIPLANESGPILDIEIRCLAPTRNAAVWSPSAEAARMYTRL